MRVPDFRHDQNDFVFGLEHCKELDCSWKSLHCVQSFDFVAHCNRAGVKQVFIENKTFYLSCEQEEISAQRSLHPLFESQDEHEMLNSYTSGAK